MHRDDDRSRGRDAHTGSAAATGPGQGPGKTTLTGSLPVAPVQARGELAGDNAHAAAEQGTRGSSQSLPHLDTLQRVFGRHDVSGVSAHVGGPAREACDSLGATAYATGNRVAFASSPDLHTAAHEAAHVVQQRAGVQLKDALGRPGDAYERHADAVADAAVAGRSAEALLDQSPGTGGGPAIQRKETGAAATADGGAGASDARIMYASAQLQAMIQRSGLPPAEIERMAIASGMTSQEIAALRGGSALVLTPAQEASLRSELAAAYARGPNGRDGTMDADICGSSGNPAPAPHQTVPAVTGTHTGVTEVNAGNTIDTATVGGGTVTLRHDIHYQKTDGSDRPHGFALSYRGSDSQNAHWLQFIWREIIQKDGSNNVTAVTGPISTSGTRGGSYDLTTGGTLTTPGAPGETNYNTDSASGTDPFYESSGANNRTADATTMYDHPGAADALVQRAFANGATQVKSRAHFVTFLVQTDHVTYRTETNMEWNFTSAGATPAPAFTTGTNGAATALTPDAIRNRFRAQFPAFAFIP